MINENIFNFLIELKFNNNREWFQANKKIYESAKSNFEVFINKLIAELSTFDESISHLTAKDCVFRIYKDTRFSNDKTPYKTHFGAIISSLPKKSEIHNKAGYYVHIEPENSMLAGGAYLPPSPWLKDIRDQISNYPDEFLSIISKPDFIKYFKTVEGEKLSRPPKGYSAYNPQIELLKMKSFLAAHYPSDEQVMHKDFLQHTKSVFKTMHPFNSFLNRSEIH